MFGDWIARAKTLPPAEAETLLEAALSKSRSQALPADVANLLVHLASYARDAGRYELALARLGEAARLFQQACGPDDARTRHARSEIAHVHERAGDLAAAIRARRALHPDESRPDYAWEHIASLEHERGDERAASEALEQARRRASSAEADPMVGVDTFIRIARRLAASGRGAEARELLAGAIRRVHEIQAGARVSPSARVTADVLSLYQEALATLLRGDPENGSSA